MATTLSATAGATAWRVDVYAPVYYRDGDGNYTPHKSDLAVLYVPSKAGAVAAARKALDGLTAPAATIAALRPDGDIATATVERVRRDDDGAIRGNGRVIQLRRQMTTRTGRGYYEAANAVTEIVG